MLTPSREEEYTLPVARKLIEGPAIEPVSVQEAIDYCRGSEDDAGTLALQLLGAREMAETYTRRAFITQVWDAIWDTPPNKPFLLMPGPVQSIDGVYLTDTNHVEGGSVDPATYIVDTVSVPCRMTLADDAAWGTTRLFAGFRVRYVAGYGPHASDVPNGIRMAMLMAVSHWYRYREASNKLPDEALKRLYPYRILLKRRA